MGIIKLGPKHIDDGANHGQQYDDGKKECWDHQSSVPHRFFLTPQEAGTQSLL
jgi:hypothetical protein